MFHNGLKSSHVPFLLEVVLFQIQNYYHLQISLHFLLGGLFAGGYHLNFQSYLCIPIWSRQFFRTPLLISPSLLCLVGIILSNTAKISFNLPLVLSSFARLKDFPPGR